MDIDINESMWWAKYRPQKIEDCILPESTKNYFQNIVDSGKLDNMTFSGHAGIGKTTVAQCLGRQLNCNVLFINASQSNGIDTIRNEIYKFGSTVSIDGGRKLVILDEADALTIPAQNALRNVIEGLSKSTNFILTCNYQRNLSDALISRCSNDVQFTTFDKEVQIDLKVKILQRCIEIMKLENIEYEKEDLLLLKELIVSSFPDIRKTINSLEKMCKSGKFLPLSIMNLNNEMYKQLFTSLKNGKFNEIRQWCAEKSTLIDSDTFFRDFYDLAPNFIENNSLANVILLISQYADRAGRVADQEINNMAFLIEVVSASQFK